MDKRIGRQTPTTSVVIPYNRTEGEEAIKLYQSTGREVMKWQQLQVYDILAINDDNLWVHTKYGLAVPRRNGKNEIITIIELYALKNGLRVLHTAHLASTAHMAWERLYRYAEDAKMHITSSYRAFGKEHIEVDKKGKVSFRTRTSKGGLGEGVDILIIDEAQEYQDAQEGALQYIVSSSENPLTIFTGTPPTPISSGTVFFKFRNQTLEGRKNSGWAEWSVQQKTDTHDVDAWYETNPSMGIRLTERIVEDEIGTDDIDFNIQRLGLWLRYNQKSAISLKEWEKCEVETTPNLRGKLFVGIKYGHDNANVALSIAVKTTTNKIFIEAYDCRPVREGTGWLIKFLKNADIEKVVIDGDNGKELLKSRMSENKIRKKPILPSVKEVILANASFEQGLFSDSIIHRNQPSLSQIVSNCKKRTIGGNGGFGYTSIKDGADIALMDSVILAYWTASESKERKKQRKNY